MPENDEDALPIEPRKPRKRARMGATVKKMGRAARATPNAADFHKAITQRAHADKARRIEQAGKNKGEQRGYGAASGKTEYPT